jgi:hypothetical protein
LLKFHGGGYMKNHLPSSWFNKASRTTGSDEFPIPPNRDRNKKLMEPTTSEGMILGGHSTSTAFRLRRKKRGSFRLKKRQVGVDGRVIMPLSYLDTYYSLGKRNNLLTDEVRGNGRIYLGLPKTLQHQRSGDDVFEKPKRGSFRLKKIPEDAIQWSVPGAKRASFRLKRILDNYRDLLGTPSVGSSSSSGFRLKKRGGTSSFRLKRIDEEGIHAYGQ